jgi:DNA-binding beta-propeller fold protein YncE
MSGPCRSASRLVRRQALALPLAGLVLLIVSAAALAVTGDLTQPAGTAGCISETGAGPCADGHGLNLPADVAVSPDGKSIYVASFDSDAVARFNRNTTTGAISQPAGAAGCVSETGAGPCADGHGLRGAATVAVSPDGENVYVASLDSYAVVRFDRDTTTGAITQPAGTAGCISDTGAGPCTDGHALGGPRLGVSITADGKNVYVASAESDAVARLTRNTTSGALTQPAGTAGCISETGAGPCGDGHGLGVPLRVALSPDDRNIYVTSGDPSAIARLNRNTTTGAITQPTGTAGCVSRPPVGAEPCADGHAIGSPQEAVVSPDGRSVYVSAGTLARFVRDTTTGAITQPAGTAGCISEDGSGPCADGHAISGTLGIGLSPDGRNIYVASASSGAVARVNRNTTTGAITQPAGTTGCISETGAGACADGHALSEPRDGVAVSPDGKNVYVNSFVPDAVVRLNRAP